MNVSICRKGCSAGLFLVVILLGSSLAIATLGGPQEITLLGYNEQERRVYWVTYFRGESGKLPQLFYIDFSWVWIPNERYGIATISFTGIPYEVGYLKDIVVLLKP